MRRSLNMFAVTVALLAGALAAVGAPVAAAAKAKPLHLLALRTCGSIAKASDFGDTVESSSAPVLLTAGRSRSESTICSFATLVGGGALEPGQLVAAACFSNFLKVNAEHHGALTPGCTGIASVQLSVARGPVGESRARSHARSTTWPSGFTRLTLHHVGTSGEYGANAAGEGFAIFHVLNASLQVKTQTGAILPVLKLLAHRL